MAALRATHERLRVAAATTTVQAGHVAEAEMKSRLHVGYGVRSGTMRRSVHVEGPHGGPDTFWSKVGPGTIYSRRFELGFYGPDSIGRVFPNDHGRPFVRPGWLAAIPAIGNLWARRAREAVEG